MTGVGPEATGTPHPSSETADGQPALTEGAQPSAIGATRFAHASEAEMARILDFYEVRWDYEPTTFPILWNLDGEVVESFAPDFYLPELEVFLEMTTLKQRLVRKKNRKLRRLRELYPDVRIKLFYARDFRAMMLKYGRLGLAESLSGTPGQVVPERVVAQIGVIDADLLAQLPAETVVEVLAEPAVALVTEAARPVIDAGLPAPTVAMVATASPDDRSAPATAARASTRSRPGRRRRRAAAAAARTGPEREGGA